MARTVRLELTANASGLVAGLRTGARAVSNFANDVNSFQRRNREALDEIGSTAGRAGAAAAAGLGLVAKAAIDWESAFTGVRKTTDATEAQYAELEKGLRSLAKTLPATHTEIAGVAEAAGQLGVARADIVGFTKTMIDLGETTNLTAEDAATNIAQISNVMGTMEREGSMGVSRFGSALVALGNDGASTEAEILSMAQRIAGAAATLGASESDVLALSNTLASMGINAELGGGVATRVLLKMRSAVDDGGESLESFAKIAGVSADDFASKFRDAPMEALDLVSRGISRVNDEGGNVTATLKEMGIKGTEETQVMLALAAAGDLLSDSLTLGNKAWDENTALLAEAEQRYGTTEAKISVAWNKIKDAAIDAGGVLLPIIGNIADAVGGLADWFNDLPGPLQAFITMLGGVGAAAGLGVGGLVFLTRTVSNLQEALAQVIPAGGRAQTALRNVGKALGAITVVGAGLLIGKAVIEGINEAVRSGKPDVQEYFNLLATGGGAGLSKGLDFKSSLTEFNNTKLGKNDRGLVSDAEIDRLKSLTKEVGVAQNAIASLYKLRNERSGFDQWFDENATWGNKRAQIDDALELEKAMKSLAQAFDMGEVELGQKALASFAEEMQLNDEMVGKLINSVPELKNSLLTLATEQGIQIDPNNELGLVDLALGRIGSSAPGAASGIEEAKQKLADMGVSATGTVEELDKLLESMLALSTGTLSVRAAERDFQESIDAVTESIKQNGKSLDEATPKGRANQATLDQVASSGLSVATALAQAKDENGNFANSQADVQKSLQSTYDETMKAATAFTGNKDKAKELTRELLGIPEGVSVSTWMDTFARDTAQETTESIKTIPGYTKVSIAVSEDGTTGQVQGKIDSVTGKTEYIFVTDDGTSVQVQAGIANINGKEVPVFVDDKGTVYSTEGKIQGIKGKDVTIKANAATEAAEAELNRTARDRQSRVIQTVQRNIQQSISWLGGAGGAERGGRGGITRASGGSVFGPGSETSDSIPAWLSNNEHVLSAREVRGLGGHGAVERLRALARNGDAPAFKSGGALGRAQDKVDRLQRQYSRMPGDKKNRNRKLDLKDDLDAAKRELAAVKKSSKDAEKAAKDAKKKADDARKAEAERQGRLSDSRRELRTDLRRGNITDAFTSGSGLSQIDKLYEVSRNSDYSKSKRRQAGRDAASLEKSLASLTKRSEGLEKALEAAKSKAEELKAVRDAVANDLRGEFKLSDMITSDSRYAKDLLGSGLTAKGIANRASATAQRIERFAHRLNRLRDKGYGETIIQEVAALGSEDGMLAANALLNATTKERNSVIRAYNRLDSASNKAGKEVTLSMYRGGIDAAEGLVNGLQSKSKDVDNAFYKLGKQAEKAFRRSLDMHSPSRVLFAAGEDAGDGVVGGGLASIPKVADTFALMGLAAERSFSPSLTVPPSVEVSRFAAAQGGQAAGIDYQKLASAMRGAGPVSLDARSIQALAQAVQPYLVMDNHVVAQANGVSNRRSTVNGKY